ncbi:hypothetical protein [Oceanirhabdus sp. W0125-5]|nr:hypothetical protein [Oceanirhabdus sp. W0125-5]WBW95293.1 hypothetical protein OW730_16545 [Oceanirhabdus sp. W0125-5]
MSKLKDKVEGKEKSIMKTLKKQSNKKSVVSCKAVGPHNEPGVWP